MDSRDHSASEVEPGAILAGRYRVEAQIGAGGMGIVVAARHLQLDSLVAIKYLPASSLSDPDAVQRFQREAWAAAQIKSPHVVRVSDVASLPSDAEIKPEWDAFLAALGRPASQTGIRALMARGFHRPGDVENRLGFYVGQLGG